MTVSIQSTGHRSSRNTWRITSCGGKAATMTENTVPINDVAVQTRGQSISRGKMGFMSDPGQQNCRAIYVKRVSTGAGPFPFDVSTWILKLGFILGLPRQGFANPKTTRCAVEKRTGFYGGLCTTLSLLPWECLSPRIRPDQKFSRPCRRGLRYNFQAATVNIVPQVQRARNLQYGRISLGPIRITAERRSRSK